MKYIKNVFYVTLVFCSILIGIKIFNRPSEKKIEFKSDQKIIIRNEKSFATPTTIKTKEEAVKITESASTTKNKEQRTIRKLAFSGDFRKGIDSKYLTELKNGYQYSDNIYAIFKKNYHGSTNRILGEYLGYLLVESEIAIENGYKLIKLENENRVGLYMEKVILIHQKSNEFESKLKELSGAISFYHLSGVYFVESKSVEASIEFLTLFKQNFPHSQADLDIQYNRIMPN